MTTYLRALGRIAGTIALLGTMIPLQTLILGPVFKNHTWGAHFTWGTMAKLTGLNLTWKGRLETTRRPVIYIGNHLSYLDLFIFGGNMKARVVGKHEVSQWPLVGPFAASLRTIFVKRNKDGLAPARRQIADALNNKDNLILFPEGTTSDGSGVLRFRTGLFAALFNETVKDENGRDIKINADVLVQPVAMRVTHVDGESVDVNPKLRERFSWAGRENPLSKHFWRVMKTKSMEVELTVLPTMNPKDYKCREDFMQAAHKQVEAIVTGRPPPPSSPKVP